MWFIRQNHKFVQQFVSKLSEFLCSKCAPCTRMQSLGRQRHWLIAASKIDLSNCVHSSIRRVLSLSTLSYLVSCYFLCRIFDTTKLLGHVAPSVDWWCICVQSNTNNHSVMWQFGTSAFNIVVCWHEFGEVENKCIILSSWPPLWKKYQRWWKFGKVLTKTILLSFFFLGGGHIVEGCQPIIAKGHHNHGLELVRLKLHVFCQWHNVAHAL